MEFEEKGCHKMEVKVDGDHKKWVLALRSSLKPIFTSSKKMKDDDDDDDDDDYECCVTPKSEEARIPSRLVCPPAPKKRKSTSRCHFQRQFFNPPDLDTVFIRRAEKA